MTEDPFPGDLDFAQAVGSDAAVIGGEGLECTPQSRDPGALAVMRCHPLGQQSSQLGYSGRRRRHAPHGRSDASLAGRCLL